MRMAVGVTITAMAPMATWHQGDRHQFQAQVAGTATPSVIVVHTHAFHWVKGQQSRPGVSS